MIIYCLFCCIFVADESVHDEATASPIVMKEKCRVSMTKIMKEANAKSDQGYLLCENILFTSEYFIEDDMMKFLVLKLKGKP